MKVGFIGLGNVGAKLAGSLLRNGFDLTVRDIDKTADSRRCCSPELLGANPEGGSRRAAT